MSSVIGDVETTKKTRDLRAVVGIVSTGGRVGKSSLNRWFPFEEKLPMTRVGSVGRGHLTNDRTGLTASMVMGIAVSIGNEIVRS